MKRNQHPAGQTAEWIEGQITGGLKDLTEEQVSNLVIAYEPIWAIGTGKSADANIADEICGVVRSTVAKLYNDTVASKVRIQYGGSVKPENIAEYKQRCWRGRPVPRYCFILKNLLIKKIL